MITGALEFVHMYVGRRMSYIFYTEILFQYLKGIKRNDELKRIYIYMFVCKLRECLLEERREWRTHQHCVEAICWMLKSLCDNVKCWENLQSAPLPPLRPLLFVKVVFQSFIHSAETPEWNDMWTLSHHQRRGSYAPISSKLASANSLVPCNCAFVKC